MTSKIEQQVMASVAVIHTARTLLSRTALECYILAVSAFALTVLVSVSHVIQNFLKAAGSPHSTILYLSTAVAHTTLVVQLVLLVAVAAFAALVIDLAKTVSSPRRLAL